MSAGIGTVGVTGKDSDFTLYVSSATSASAKLIDIDGSPDSAGVYDNRIKQSFEGEITFATASTTLGNLVDFTVTSGSGRLYFDNDDRNSAKNRHTIGITEDGAASIRFKPSGSGVTIVQAALRGRNQKAYQTFFSSFANLVKVDDVSGRTGVVGTRLYRIPFTVEVRDGEDRHACSESKR